MTGYRSSHLRWDCQAKGCYHDGLPDWSDLLECFPRRIRPTDIDGMVELNGHFLFLEQKSPGKSIEEGQGLALRRLCERPGITAVIFRPGGKSDLECLIYSSASLLPGWEPYSGFRARRREEFRMWLTEWVRVALSSLRLPQLALTCLESDRHYVRMARQPASLGTRIRRARERKRMKRPDVAAALGVSLKTIDNWENDRTHPRDSLGALGELLDEDFYADLPPPTLLDERLGREDADIIRRLLRDMEPDRADAILAGLEERLRRRAAGHG